jgi:hypothetical protein
MITDQDSPGEVGSDVFPSTNARDVVITSAVQRFRFESECAYLIWPHRDYLFWPHSASGIGGVRVN